MGDTVQYTETIHVDAKVTAVAKNLEAFLWADNNRPEGGATVAVNKVNSRTFEEVEAIDPELPDMNITTRYELKAAPKGTTITATADVPDIIAMLAEMMGEDIQGGLAEGAVAWGQRLSAFVKAVELGDQGQQGVA